MSTHGHAATLGLSEREAAALGDDAATRVRVFRLLILLTQELRTAMDELLRSDDLTTQQAALTTVVDAIGSPSMSQAAAALGTTHQNVKQLASALERKGFLRFDADEADGRVRRLVTTPKGRETWRRRSASDQEHILDWFSCLSPAEAQQLFEFLVRLEGQIRARLAGMKHGEA